MFTSLKTRTNRGFAEGACKVATAGTIAAFTDSTPADTFTTCNTYVHDVFAYRPRRFS